MADDLFDSDIDDDDFNDDDDGSDNYITLSENDGEDEEDLNPLGVLNANNFSGGHRFWMDDFLDDALDDYEEEDNDSEESDWLDDDEEFDMEGLALWQATTGRDSPVREQHLIQSKSINIVDHLKSREVGETRFVKAQKTSTLLSFSLKPCWTSVPRVDMLLNAKALLGRRLYRWEGAILDFFQRRAMERSFDAGPRNKALSILLNESEGIVPITFTDIIDVLLKTGAQLDARNESGHGVLLDFLKYNELHEDGAEFFEHLRQRGLDVTRDADEAVGLLCDSFRDGPITNAKLRVLEVIFDAGVELSQVAKRDLISKLTRNILKEANRTAVKVLALLIKHGCHPNEALLTMDNLDYPFDSPRSADRFDCILAIADALLENGAQVNVSPDDPWRLSFLFKILDSARRQATHASFLGLLVKCVDRGLDLDVTGNSLKNLLMAFCEQYKNDDLARVIRFLCSRGVDVNAVDRYGRSALFYLAENEPANRAAVYEALATLVELGIDVKRTDSSGCTILIKFLSSDSSVVPCCYYKGLKTLNESSFWDVLDLLVDAGVDVNRRDDVSIGALHALLDHLTGLKSESGTICEQCSASDFASASEEEAIASLDVDHFERALNFVQRLVKAGAQLGDFSTDYATPLLYVCSHFGGEQLVSLVKLLCESGVDVNEKTASFLGEHPSQRIDAIGVLREVNRSQSHLADRLIGIMLPYGFEV